MFTLIRQLHRIDLLTITGLLRLVEALLTTGVNLMAMLRITAKLHPHRIAVIDDQGQLSYTELWHQAESLAVALHLDYGIQRKQRVAIACRNHAAAIKAIFAASRLGTHVFLLNPEMSTEQLLALEKSRNFDFYVYDEPLAPVFETPLLSHKALPAYHPTNNSIDRITTVDNPRRIQLRKVKTGNIIVMTGGTTGQPKSAGRKPSIFNFLPPFFALLTQVKLDRYKSVYIATPIYHGFGVASLIMGVALGVTMYFTSRFQADRSAELIEKHQIEVITLVPLMLQRMLQLNSGAMASLRCIISGGALLNPTLTQETFDRLNARLFNMYGTSEAGFCIMATPEVLAHKPGSIGKAVQGVRAKVTNDLNQIVGDTVIGRLSIQSAWTTNQKSWVETGDLAYRDPDGDLFLCGRVDDMIVSGGENVYPIELENILIQHPDIDAVGVIGIPDQEFGQRLKAVVRIKPAARLDQLTLRTWLKPRISRHQMPATIEFRDELPYTPLGKLDKKALRH
jgi:fatty-acyl-CoA synthase